MHIVSLVTSDHRLTAAIAPLVDAARPGREVEEVEEVEPARALEYLSIEMPKLYFLDFDDPSFDAFALLDQIMADPWLHHGGIVALCDDHDRTDRLEKICGANILTVIGRDHLETTLPRLMRIVDQNQRLLFQRHFADLIGDISGQVKLANDPLEARCYENLVCNYLHTSNRIDQSTKSALHLSIDEMLMNAIEHGNCGISYEEKSAWLESGRGIAELIAQRCLDPEIARRRVTFDYHITAGRSRFRVADEGEGFDWRAIRDPASDENVLKQHGRGILMARVYTDNLTYNEKGNEVSFEIIHQTDQANATPALFEGIEAHRLEAGDVVLRQGEASASLFYIVKGRYDVSIDGEHVDTLSPDDLFLGEMSLLLHSRRTATVIARSAGRLVEISKQRFVEAIRKNPQYAIFLCRMLAGRLELRTGNRQARDRPAEGNGIDSCKAGRR